MLRANHTFQGLLLEKIMLLESIILAVEQPRAAEAMLAPALKLEAVAGLEPSSAHTAEGTDSAGASGSI